MKETCLRQLSDSFTSTCAAITCCRLMTMMMMMMVVLMPAPVSSTLSLRYRDDESAAEADWLANQLDADDDQGAIQSSASNSYQIDRDGLKAVLSRQRQKSRQRTRGRGEADQIRGKAEARRPLKNPPSPRCIAIAVQNLVVLSQTV